MRLALLDEKLKRPGGLDTPCRSALLFHAAKIQQNFDPASVRIKIFACAIIRHNLSLSLSYQNVISCRKPNQQIRLAGRDTL